MPTVADRIVHRFAVDDARFGGGAVRDRDECRDDEHTGRHVSNGCRDCMAAFRLGEWFIS